MVSNTVNDYIVLLEWIPIDTTTPGQSGLGSNKGLLHNPQSSKTGASPSNGFVSYPGHWLAGFTPLQGCSRLIQQPQPTGLLH